MKAVCLDSSAWIEITHNGPNADIFQKALRDITETIVPTLTLYEIWKYTATHADELRAQQFIDFLRQGVVIAPDPEICIAAAKLSRRHKTAMADSLIHATALAHNAILWTQDADLKDLPHVRYYPKNPA